MGRPARRCARIALTADALLGPRLAGTAGPPGSQNVRRACQPRGAWRRLRIAIRSDRRDLSRAASACNSAKAAAEELKRRASGKS